jgi:hypothetical protein
MYQRPFVFRIWAEQVKYLMGYFPQYEYEVIVAGSEQYLSKQLVEEYGFTYLEIENKPVGRKHNERLGYVNERKADVVVFLSSDDIMSAKTFYQSIKAIKDGYDLVQAQDIYYYDKPSGKSFYFSGYVGREGAIAVGRVMTGKTLNKLHPIYNPKISQGLDVCEKERIEQNDLKILTYNHKSSGTCVLDIKSPVNITAISHRINDKTLISDDKIKQHFPDHVNEMIFNKDY